MFWCKGISAHRESRVAIVRHFHITELWAYGLWHVNKRAVGVANVYSDMGNNYAIILFELATTNRRDLLHIFFIFTITFELLHFPWFIKNIKLIDAKRNFWFDSLPVCQLRQNVNGNPLIFHVLIKFVKFRDPFWWRFVVNIEKNNVNSVNS